LEACRILDLNKEPILRRRLFLLALATPILPTTVRAQEVVHPRSGSAGEWRLIGQVHAAHTADHDSISIRGPYDNFRRIKFKVSDAPLNMQRMVVIYDNGEPDRIDVRHYIRQGGESRVIDLRGGSRSLRRIDFWYETSEMGRGTADVTVFGMK
jgi:hypothetical protein